MYTYVDMYFIKPAPVIFYLTLACMVRCGDR
jgi:hypothetical protein